MRVDVYAPLLASLLLAAAMGPVASRLAPATATRLLVGTAVSTALLWGWMLALLGWTVVAQISAVAAQGHWSRSQLHAHDPVNPALAWGAGAAFVMVAIAAVLMTVRRARATWAAWQLAREVCPAADGGDLVILPDSTPRAFAVPGVRGRVVVSAGMLRALDAGERRVLLDHERSHLRHRHDLWLSAAYLAAAANPLLARLPATIGLLIERWADEDAAAAVCDRQLTRQAIARAGLATVGATRQSDTSTVALPAASSHIKARIDALAAGPITAGKPLVIGTLALLALTFAAAIDAGHDTEATFEAAMGAHHPATGRPVHDGAISTLRNWQRDMVNSDE